MKASDLIYKLQELPEGSEVCALWWTQETFDDAYQPLTDIQWGKVCAEFDAFYFSGENISEWISDAIIDTMIEEVE